MAKEIKAFEEVRNWRVMRGIEGSDLKTSYSKFAEESQEILDAIEANDPIELSDSLGDTLVTLIGIATSSGTTLEDDLAGAFSIIKYRKGRTMNDGNFIRYAKLSDKEKSMCDVLQGSPGDEYFTELALKTLTPPDFKFD